MTSEERTLTPEQRGAIEAAGESRNALVEAQEHLIKALGRPQPGRERRWAVKVADELRAARDALGRYRAEVESDEGLYGELQRDAPWLQARLHQFRNQLSRFDQEAAHLAQEVDRVTGGDTEALPAIRNDAEHMLVVLRDLFAREADLIWEQFNEPAALD
jgi:hypothetical protein